MSILNNFVWIVLAYLIGSLNFSILLTKLVSNKKDIRKEGSGNAGATNAARIYGTKFGLIVLFLDTSKSYWFGFTLGYLQANTESFSDIIPQLALLFVILGHIFPIYFGFRGGKGAATLLGMIASISIVLAVIGAILFFCVVYFTKYVSLGSIIVPYILVVASLMVPYLNNFDSMISYGVTWVTPVSLLVGSIIVTACHWQNIDRLIKGKENKVKFNFNKNSFKKSFSKKSNDENTLEIKDLENIEFDEIQNNTSTIENALSENSFKNNNEK